MRTKLLQKIKHLHIIIEEWQYEELREQAYKNKVSVNHLIREALRRTLKGKSAS